MPAKSGLMIGASVRISWIPWAGFEYELQGDLFVCLIYLSVKSGEPVLVAVRLKKPSVEAASLHGIDSPSVETFFHTACAPASRYPSM